MYSMSIDIKLLLVRQSSIYVCIYTEMSMFKKKFNVNRISNIEVDELNPTFYFFLVQFFLVQILLCLENLHTCR